ncbi:hypothetical protein Patl1_19352 [Pistacia atlantica]|uniref:Uncharacterized protein n=1 Tax=Pistacia atlantica TaxID=434234 RepID=A0ACC1C1L3_9ROSI|nr:hypothetical protein Patl1_19352 [Pistacia atlantica]
MKVHLPVFTPIFWWQHTRSDSGNKISSLAKSYRVEIEMGLPRRRAWGWGNRWFPIPPIAQSWPANTNNFSGDAAVG